MGNITIRYAEEKDCELILKFIRELASYEYMLDDVVATEELLREWLFQKQEQAKYRFLPFSWSRSHG